MQSKNSYFFAHELLFLPLFRDTLAGCFFCFPLRLDVCKLRLFLLAFARLFSTQLSCLARDRQIGRASCRERVYIAAVAESLKRVELVVTAAWRRGPAM